MELTLRRFFFDIPIYEPIQVSDSNIQVIQTILLSPHIAEFEGYNPWKKYESTFGIGDPTSRVVHQAPGIISSPSLAKHAEYTTIKIHCKRSGDYFWYLIHWYNLKKTLTKVGQHPSVADFHMGGTKQYKKVLPVEKLKEFSKAIGLAAHGVGIGSFVYLRRIFEHLINEAYEKCLSDGSVTEERYNKSRMDEKIELLKSHLPSFLVDNKSIYSVLSRGIHELDENTCLVHFETLKDGIELILDEKLEELRKEEKTSKAGKEIAALKGKLPH